MVRPVSTSQSLSANSVLHPTLGRPLRLLPRGFQSKTVQPGSTGRGGGSVSLSFLSAIRHPRPRLGMCSGGWLARAPLPTTYRLIFLGADNTEVERLKTPINKTRTVLGHRTHYLAMTVLSQTTSPDPLVESRLLLLLLSHPCSLFESERSPEVHFHSLDPRVKLWVHGQGFRCLSPETFHNASKYSSRILTDFQRTVLLYRVCSFLF